MTPMCNHCRPNLIASPHEPRRAFLKRLLAGASAGLLGASPWARALGPPRGPKVQWARLATTNPYWKNHIDEDPVIAQFIRDQTRLNLDPTVAIVQAAALDQMDQFPLIFTNNLIPAASAGSTANLREYLSRGGFFYVDGCVAWKATPDFPAFYQAHLELFQTLFPGADVRMLPETDPIFRAFFNVDEAATRNGGGPRGHWGEIPEGLYGVFHGGRMISLLSLDHLLCGWPNDQVRTANCIRQIANIYVYAMTR